MTDEQIVKALECSPLIDIGGCRKIDALDLINRKDAEIERLKEYETALKKGCALSRCINKGFVQDEAYKEFAERLHQKCKKYPYTLPSVFTNIEITYKELTGGGNEDG